MNRGRPLAVELANEFGSVQCAALTRCDFSTFEGAERYAVSGGVARCRALAEVAQRVLATIQA